MSAPRALAQLVVDSLRITGKAFAAAGRQAMANARHKPDAPEAGPSGSGGGGSKAVTQDLGMSLEEAHLILNVKKEESMEKILENYERIFAANSPPPPPKEKEAVGPQAGASNARQRAKAKGPTHSHYLQSKVYRALERIQAERANEQPEAEAAEAASEAAEGAAEGAPESKKEGGEGKQGKQ
ncbi:hypothetical protein CspHIS471_0100730 [Cutaneotrichosporon sp. HIS471]|nr:hypothetical protein CspHIS471_0100730 [Cutaneotrichosporon sp. HIS471]